MADVKLPDGMVSAEDHAGNLRAEQYLHGLIASTEIRDSRWRAALDEAQARIAEVEQERDGLVSREHIVNMTHDAWDCGHNAGYDGVKGAASDEQRDDDCASIIAEVIGPAPKEGGNNGS